MNKEVHLLDNLRRYSKFEHKEQLLGPFSPIPCKHLHLSHPGVSLSIRNASRQGKVKPNPTTVGRQDKALRYT